MELPEAITDSLSVKKLVLISDFMNAIEIDKKGIVFFVLHVNHKLEKVIFTEFCSF